MIKHNVSGGLILQGHVLDALSSLPEQSVSCCVTSPPYWGHRKYEAPDVIWGGDESCEHEWEKDTGAHHPGQVPETKYKNSSLADAQKDRNSHTCSRCAAWKGQFGLEPTPELYVEHTIEILRAIRRVLRDDGVVWWNIGDGFSSSGGHTAQGKNSQRNGRSYTGNEVPSVVPDGIPAKNLILMPERIALAAQADGWFIRQRIIWHKPNVKPESVQDRPTLDYEHIWMMTKNAKYWYDRTAVLEPHAPDGRKATKEPIAKWKDQEPGLDGHERWPGSGRNLRSVWSFPTAQYKDAHYAVFPLELPKRCILASCPPEICVRCDTPRVRITSRGAQPDDHTRRLDQERKMTEVTVKGLGGQRHQDWLDDHPLETVGWSDCECEEPDYQPGIVLDPFFGTGSTGLASRELGRLFIGVEISDAYIEMAKKRLGEPVPV